jgi:outer membrane protein assembly factor BamD (BamD/ComL family)
MDKLIIALMIPGSIILCLVAGKRLWIRVVSIVLLILAMGVIVPNLGRDHSLVALDVQSSFLKEFVQDIQKLIETKDYDAAQLRLAEFNRRFPGVSRNQDLTAFAKLMGELKAITNEIPKDKSLNQNAANRLPGGLTQ